MVERSGRRPGCSPGVEVALGWAGDEGAVGHEQVEVVKLPLATAINMLTAGEIKDAKTMIALGFASSRC